MIQAAVLKRLGQFVLDVHYSGSGITCITGGNGSGKTTFLRLVAGHLRPDSGYVRVDGVDVTDLPPERRGVVLIGQNSYLPSKSLADHLRWGARVRGVPAAEGEVREVASALGVPMDWSGPVDALSAGNRVRVSVATAILSRPRAILVDEAFSAISDRREFLSSFSSIVRSRGIDAIIVTHDPSEVEDSDGCYLMDSGRLKPL